MNLRAAAVASAAAVALTAVLLVVLGSGRGAGAGAAPVASACSATPPAERSLPAADAWWDGPRTAATASPASRATSEATGTTCASAATRSPRIPTPTTGPAWTGTAAEKRFAWAEDGLMSSGATVTLVRGLTPDEALRIVAAHRTTPIEAAGRARLDAGYKTVTAGRVGAWTLVVEIGGARATGAAVQRRLSAAGPAIVVFQNSEAAASFSYAVHGRIRRSFDPLIFGTPWIGRPLPQERGIGFGAEHDMHPMAQSFLLAYRLSGIALTERALTTTHGRIGAGVS